MANEIVIRVRGVDDASKTFEGITTKANGFGSALSKIGAVAGGFLAAGAIQQGFGALTGFLNDSTTAARESMAADAQLGAVLKSTGGIAGVTADAAKKLASELEKVSLFEDEAILGGQSILLTFKSIGKDVFPRATQAITDMSQALGQDLQSSAIQLGKALNDPIQGITALRRVGVSFTEEQMEQIRVMQESGDLMGAQTLILSELESQFGGSAKAASDAAGETEKYKDKMNATQELIGAKMIPIQEKLNEAKLALVTLLADKVIPILEELYVKHWPAVQKAIDDTVKFIEENWPKIQPIIEFAKDYVVAQIEGMIQAIQAVVQIVTGVIDLVDALIHGRWSEAWDAAVQIVSAVPDLIIGVIKSKLGNLPDIMYDIGKKSARRFLDGLGDISVAGISINDVGGVIGDALSKLPVKPFATGTPYVPRDMLAMVHQGEAIIPASQNMGGGGGGLTINVYGSLLSTERDLEPLIRQWAGT